MSEPFMPEPTEPAEPTIVRPMTAADLEAVEEIERASFSTPWQIETFRGLIGREGVELIVLEDGDGGAVVGHAVVWRVLDQAELANIAIAPDRRGQGLGARLLRAVIERAREREVRTLYLEVRESNEAAITLYRGFGFEQVGRRKAYYTRPREDALVMELRLG